MVIKNCRNLSTHYALKSKVKMDTKKILKKEKKTMSFDTIKTLILGGSIFLTALAVEKPIRNRIDHMPSFKKSKDGIITKKKLNLSTTSMVKVKKENSKGVTANEIPTNLLMRLEKIQNSPVADLITTDLAESASIVYAMKDMNTGKYSDYNCSIEKINEFKLSTEHLHSENVAFWSTKGLVLKNRLGNDVDALKQIIEEIEERINLSKNGNTEPENSELTDFKRIVKRFLLRASSSSVEQKYALFVCIEGNEKTTFDSFEELVSSDIIQNYLKDIFDAKFMVGLSKSVHDVRSTHAAYEKVRGEIREAEKRLESFKTFMSYQGDIMLMIEEYRKKNLIGTEEVKNEE